MLGTLDKKKIKKKAKKAAKKAKKKAKKLAKRNGTGGGGGTAVALKVKKETKEETSEVTWKGKTGKNRAVIISAPNMEIAMFLIQGNAPYVQSKFSEKALSAMRKTQELGSVSRKGQKKKPKDFESLFEGAIHRSDQGWAGIPAGGIRAALVSACKIAGFAMTRAKLSLFIEADGFDKGDGTPLVKITRGQPKHVEHAVRIQQTTDIRVRAMWDPGWQAKIRVRYDADQFSLEDVSNLLLRVGMQVGLGEGRPDSRSSTGMGWGTFDLVN